MHPAGIHNPSYNYCLPGHTWLLIPPLNYLEVLPARLKSPVFHNFGVRSEESVRMVHNNFAACKYLFSDQCGSKFVIYNPPITCFSERSDSNEKMSILNKCCDMYPVSFLTRIQYLIFFVFRCSFPLPKLSGHYSSLSFFLPPYYFCCITFALIVSSDSTAASIPPFSSLSVLRNSHILTKTFFFHVERVPRRRQFILKTHSFRQIRHTS